MPRDHAEVDVGYRKVSRTEGFGVLWLADSP
jgi:hypothetical protein